MQKLAVFFTILAAGIGISLFTTRTDFDLKSISVLVFFLVFIPTIIRPNLGFIIIIVSMLFSPEIVLGEVAFRQIAIRIEDVFLLVVILAWFIKMALTKDIAQVFRTKLSAPIFLYLGLCLFSTVLGMMFSDISIGRSLFSMLKYLEYFLLFFMVKDNLKTEKQARFFVMIFLLVALAAAFHGNMFIQQSRQAGTAFFRAAPPVESRGGGEAGTFAGYLMFMLAIAGGLFLYLKKPMSKICLGVLLLMLVRVFLYTLSRGSYLAFLPMVFALIIFSKKYNLTYIVSVLLVLMFLFMPTLVKNRITGTFVERTDLRGKYIQLEDSPRERVDSWKVVLFHRLPNSPIFGHGVAKHFIDGQIFLILNEVGLLGLAVFIWMISRIFKLAKASLEFFRERQDDFNTGLCVGFLAGFVGLLFNAIGTNVFIIIRIMEPFWFMAAIVLSLPQLVKEKTTGTSDDQGLMMAAQ